MQPLPGLPSNKFRFRPATLARRPRKAKSPWRPLTLPRWRAASQHLRRHRVPAVCISATLIAALFILPVQQHVLIFPTTTSSTYALFQATIFELKSAAPDQGRFDLQVGSFYSGGSRNTWDLLQTGAINSGLMQYDAFRNLCGTGTVRCGVVATLYQEVMLTFLRQDLGAGTLRDIAVRFTADKNKDPFTVCCLSPEGSQTRLNLDMILRHHGFKDWRIVCADYDQSKKMLLKGSVHAAFFVGSPLHPLLQSLAESRHVRLVGISSPEGLVKKHSALSEHTVETGTFGAGQTAPVTTLSTPCVLVVSYHVPGHTVRALMDWLLDKRHLLQQRHEFLSIQVPPAEWQDRAHPGIKSSSSWLSVFSEERVTTIISIISIVTAIVSLIAAWLAYQKERKHVP